MTELVLVCVTVCMFGVIWYLRQANRYLAESRKNLERMIR